jgi:UDP-3-O-acyl-N-acetylglucosamine deacetylase
MFIYQRTLKGEIHFEGIGLHTGYPVRLTLKPAPPDAGIRFRRTDLKNFEIEAIRSHVAKVSYATTLMKKGVMISTVEHLLSTLYGLCIDNAYLDIDSLEVPILDGSSGRFIAEILQTGIEAERLETTVIAHRCAMTTRSQAYTDHPTGRAIGDFGMAQWVPEDRDGIDSRSCCGR